MADLALMLEAEKRGLLPPDQTALLAEARSRGLAPGGAEKSPPPAPPQKESLFNNAFLTGVQEGAAPGAELVGGIGDLMGAGMRAIGIKTRDTSKPLKNEQGNYLTVPGEYLTPGTVKDENFQPQTMGQRYAKTLGQFTSGAALGPEGLIPRALSVALPAVGAQTANELFPKSTIAPLIGGLVGGAGVGLASRGATGIVNALRGVKSANVVDAVAPTVADWHDIATTNYDALKTPENNPVIATGKLKDLVTQVREKLASEAFDPQLHPSVAKLWKTIKSLPKGDDIHVDPDLAGEIDSIFGPGMSAPDQTIPSIKGSTLLGLETVRKQAVQAGKNFMTSDGRLANQVKGVVSNFMDNIDPEADIVGTAAGATSVPGLAQLQAARPAWQTMKKAQTIQAVIDNADIRGAANYSQAGSDGALRRGFANLAVNQKKMAQFSPAEQDAILQVAKGDNATNALRKVGAMFAVRGPITALATSTIGHALGPAGPYMLAAAGEAAKRGAADATTANVEALNSLVRGGPEAVTKLKALRQAALMKGLQNYGPVAVSSAPYLATQGATALAN